MPPSTGRHRRPTGRKRPVYEMKALAGLVFEAQRALHLVADWL